MQWVTIKDYTKRSRIPEYDGLMALANSHEKRGYYERFRRIDGKVHINTDYDRDREQEIIKLEGLYFKVREFFESDHALALYFAPIVNKRADAVKQYFKMFRFGGTRPSGYVLRRAYIKAFTEFLKDRQ